MLETLSFILMVCRLLVLAFDVFALGTAILTSRNSVTDGVT
jgi:hypothetical protein